MIESKKCNAKISIRLPKHLASKIEKTSNLPNCKYPSDNYRFFLQTGVNAYDEYQKILTDPEHKERSKNALEIIFKDEMLVETLMDMDVSKIKGLSMAIDMVRSKRKI